MIFKKILFCAFLGSAMSIHAQHHQDEANFDCDWFFSRYGMQTDGSRKSEPSGVELPGFGEQGWRALDLPHDWGIEGPFRNEIEGFTGKLPWRGIGWYRKHFFVSKDDCDKRFYIDFDGAMANAEVWVNGQKAGSRPYGYISFRVDATPYLKHGQDNVVAVRLNTEILGSRWYPGAGIYRHVRLVKTAPVHVAHWGVFVTTPEVSDESATASVQINLQNDRQSSTTCSYRLELFETDVDDRLGKRVAESRRAEFTLEPQKQIIDSVRLEIKHPKLWHLDSPHRYMVRVTLYEKGQKSDIYTVPFGIRTIEFTHANGFLLNGKRVPINGVCNHHDLGALGAVTNTAALRRQISILQSFGCNAIRTSHNPPSPDLLDLADKMGMLIVDESFDSWNYSKKQGDYGSLYKEWHERDLESLILRDRNHPSVIMWSTGNEVREQYHPETGEARHLTEVVHRYDTTRPATFGASYPSKSAMNGTELQVDVHGMNYPAGVYGGRNFLAEFQAKAGHENLAGYTSESSSTISSRGEYFPRPFHVTSYDLKEPGWGGLPDWEWEALDRAPGICGEFVWTGFDYLGEPTPFNSDASVLLNHTGTADKELLAAKREELEKIECSRPPSRSSYFGIVDLCGFPKDRFYLYQSRWMPDKPMAHILPHWDFPDRIGQETPVFVYTSGDEAELFLNGVSQGRQRKAEFQYRFRWDHVVYAPGTLRVVTYKNGKPWAEDVVETTGEPVALKLTPDKTILQSDGDDLVFVRISIVDADGREVPTAEPTISCKVEGTAGKIIATDNGDPTSHVSFQSTERKAFNGLMLAIIKAQRDAKGVLHFSAEAEGLQRAEFTIKVKR